MLQLVIREAARQKIREELQREGDAPISTLKMLNSTLVIPKLHHPAIRRRHSSKQIIHLAHHTPRARRYMLSRHARYLDCSLPASFGSTLDIYECVVEMVQLVDFGERFGWICGGSEVGFSVRSCDDGEVPAQGGFDFLVKVVAEVDEIQIIKFEGKKLGLKGINVMAEKKSSIMGNGKRKRAYAW